MDGGLYMKRFSVRPGFQQGENIKIIEVIIVSNMDQGIGIG